MIYITFQRYNVTPTTPIAVLHQAVAAPVLDGARKPAKPGGYADSGADIAFALRLRNQPVITPQADPDPANDQGWTFPDTLDGIHTAIAAGAEVLWANTVLFHAHPLQSVLHQTGIVGQHPDLVETYDNKWTTRNLLAQTGCPVPLAIRVGPEIRTSTASSAWLATQGLSFPLVVKPIRGRGSQGVSKVNDIESLQNAVNTLLNAVTHEEGRDIPVYGHSVILEEYLPGEEITITVMPPGHYEVRGKTVQKTKHWALPAIRRINHREGILPYSGNIPVIENSFVLPPEQQTSPAIARISRACEQAAQAIMALAPIRIDCRADKLGRLVLFDLNMKPNMTGAGRPGREAQDSLSALAAQAIGWSYPEFLSGILQQAWTI